MSTTEVTLPLRNVQPTGTKIYPICPNCKVRLLDNECPKCDYIRVVGYKLKPDTDMRPHGFRKELRWRQIVWDGKEWHSIVHHFNVNKLPCNNCKTSDYAWLMAGRTGVYRSCLGCNVGTTGPITMEEAVELSDNIISPEEAVKIYKNRQLKPPQHLIRQILRNRSRIPDKSKGKKVEVF